MTNIYDLIADLYTDDESWNQVLRREYADEFLRREAFACLLYTSPSPRD